MWQRFRRKHKNLGDVLVLDNILDKDELQSKLNDKLTELNIL